MRKALASLTLLLSSIPTLVFAATPIISGSGTGLTLASVLLIITNIINTLWEVASLAMVGGLAYAGFLMVTAQGEKVQFEKGKTMLWQVIIGALVITGVGLILNTIAGIATNPVGALH